ncbi:MULTISPECIES: hypothetical protein [unclassified Sulfitobacter]|jgi:hypothetical protein|uniref:hypothetical protein n=3 Tax=Sulfitobacter TaxID=60136 RepID=UPI0007C30C29|nr:MULTISPECIES: hypothetical protein [unclassified Sulfitobacter]KZY01808.1 hypothetical protein A3721_04700 [Sulfitobacter sp. HI0023]KZY26356.1 hypothetical protein A3728_16125 [Sulfitobacter sp. HI0040]KZZ68330.1 hypothetical protein A3764_13175 [Sulfitobacter sp. HI0129]
MTAVSRADTQTPRIGSLRLVYMRSNGGHRQEYQDLFASLFGLSPSTGRIGLTKLRSLVGARKLLFGTIDDDIVSFFLVALLRALLFRRTVGLFLRPHACLQSQALSAKAKRIAFSFMRRVNPVSVFAIIPFSIAPEYATVTDDGLVDPQLWDMTDASKGEIDAEFSERIAAEARCRRVLAFVGTAAEIKGIGLLRDMMADPNWPSEKILVVVAGRFPDENGVSVEELQGLGALVLPRFISDSELRTLYAKSEFIWTCYQPNYDQASGVFGRAVQSGRIPVVRSQSLIAHFASQIGTPTVELDWTAKPHDNASLLVGYNALQTEGLALDQEIMGWKKDFISKIERALG